MEKYEIVRTLGRGSYGKVELAKLKSTGEQFAVKKVKLESMSPSDRSKALDEATFLSKLDHPNIVAYHESFQENNSLYIAMEYMDGGDLEKKIAQRGHSFLTEQDIMFSFVQVLSALTYLHSKNILHRDIKPQNCFLTRHGVVKLGDFGVARSLDCGNLAKTVIGTPFYLAPEIWDNVPYSFAADVYSLGVVLYELCSLKKPYEAETAPELLMKVTKGEVKPIPDFFSKDLKQLISKMMMKDPSLRPTCAQIVQMDFIQKAIKDLVEYNKTQKPEKISVPKTMFSPKGTGKKKPFGQLGRGRLLLANVITQNNEEEEKPLEFEDDFIEDDFIDDDDETVDEDGFHLLEVVTSRLQQTIMKKNVQEDPFRAESLRERLENQLGEVKLAKLKSCLSDLSKKENRDYVKMAENEDRTAVDDVRELIQLES
ncbi:Serine/threonine-protein kinase Nek3 [Tritrichomonas foetus]|uniref:non-specific serine/threonine protein kinase n=1 Tax=Tritrichomonas foetus TaxID=1144522 RepID=A0A1J4JYK7_9EUKA|nr:Serine/threonine-protein kinase Nek3 [Tritrichomonas foetus]|eukprot:OHT02582.1 Serine/threonine-protein kinase Nek3 [Tritrichomonas foetus]